MPTLIVAFFTLVIVSTILFILFQYGDWKVFNTSNLRSNTHKGGTAYFKWNAFKPIYTLSPQRFRYEPIVRESFHYELTSSKFLIFDSSSNNDWATDTFYGSTIYTNVDKIVRIQLSFFGYLMFKWMIIFPKSSYGNVDTVIDTIKKDIENRQALAQKQIQQATGDMNILLTRLSKEIKHEG